MPSDRVHLARASLAALGTPQVWSLLVTVFGELAVQENEPISGLTLSRIMTALDIRPAATRVALHRLRQEGWIASERIGRSSLHRLTPDAFRETDAARRRIYAPPGKTGKGRWVAIIADPTAPDPVDEMTRTGFFRIQNRLYIGQSDAVPPRDGLVLQGTVAPAWVRDALGTHLRSQDYAYLCAALEKVDKLLPDTAHLNPLERAALRCQIVHPWRRLVLRRGDLPAGLFPENWRGPECHVLVNRLLTKIERPTVLEISDA